MLYSHKNLHNLDKIKLTKDQRFVVFLSLLTAAVSSSTLVATSSNAAIISSTAEGGHLIVGGAGWFEYYPNSTVLVREEAPEFFEVHNPDWETFQIQAWAEKQNVTLTRDIYLWDHFNWKDYPWGNGPTPADWQPNVVVEAGEIVSSYLILSDPPGKGETGLKSSWTGTITFSEEILGIIPFSTYEGNPYGYTFTDDLFLPSGVSYNIDPPSLMDADEVNIDGAQLSFSINTQWGTDSMRVIVRGSSQIQVVPEPLFLLGTGVAIGFGTFFKHKISKKQKLD